MDSSAHMLQLSDSVGRNIWVGKANNIKRIIGYDRKAAVSENNWLL